MPFVPIPLTVKMEIIGSCDGQDIINVLHYKYPGSAPNASTLTTFLGTWDTAHRSRWLAIHGAGYTLVEYHATDIAAPGGAFAVYNLPPGTVGTSGSVMFPNNVALAISWRTGLTGRTNRGRTFVGGIDRNSTVGDTATTAYLASLASFATNLVSLLVSGFDFGIASQKDAAIKIVTGYVLEAIMDSMRRRLPQRGT